MLKGFFIRWLAASVVMLVAHSTSAGTVVRLGNITQISGPQDLDLEGDIVYAINFSANDPVRTVQGVAFQPDRLPISGATLIGPQQVTPWQAKPEFGSTADANQLEDILHDIRWADSASNERLRATLQVRAGEEYKLQILISGNRAEDRRWDIRVNGSQAVDEITSLGASPGQSYSQRRATLYTYQFTPTTANIVVEMGNLFGANDGGDRNPIWQALIVERVFIPPTPEDILLEPDVFFANQTEPLSRLRAVDRKGNVTHQFSLVPGEGSLDNAKFALEGNELRPAIDFRGFPAGTVFKLRIRATDSGDAGRFLEKEFTVRIGEPHPPTEIRLDVASIHLMSRAAAKVAEINVVDEDTFDRHSLQLVEGEGSAHNHLFTVTDGELRTALLLPPGSTEVRIRLRAVDLSGASVEASFVLPVLSPRLVINEVVSSYSGLSGTSEDSDLVEIRNQLAQWVDLTGWHLSDRENDPRKWQFPPAQIGPNSLFVVIADGRGAAPSDSTNLHANFSLDASGEWTGLSDPNGGVVSELAFPQLFPGVAYGIAEDGRTGYLPLPTPGKMNGPRTEFGANEVIFSRPHGFYEDAFNLELSATVPETVIRYTIDGTRPTPTTGLIYSAPIQITPNITANTRGVRIIRALPVNAKAAYAHENVQTYLFIDGRTAPATDGVVSQSRLASSIRNSSVYGPLLSEAFRALPALSVLLANPPNDTEQAASIELFDPNNAEEGFQINCGISVTGTSSLNSPKLSMAAKFRAKYGRSRLQYPVFSRGTLAPEGAATEFKELRLRSHSHDNFHWLAERDYPPLPYGTPPVTRGGDAQLARNLWNDAMQLLMGQPGKRGRQVHLYLNGAYHGIYHIHEHADEDFMASYYPGGSDEFHYAAAALSGSEHAQDDWRDAWAALKSSLGNYQQAQRWVDVTNLCDYMVLSFYSGNDWDWSSQHNWSAAGPNAPDRGGWKFFAQDSDISLQDVNADCTDQDVPDGIFTSLMRYPDFRVLFRDRFYKHCFNGGALTRSGEVYDRLMTNIFSAIVAETARWQPGSSVGALPWDRDQEWRNEWNYLRNTFFPQRTTKLVAQLKKHSGWWRAEPPALTQYSGTVPAGFQLGFTSPVGTIYYTLDGSDPRLPGGSINPRAHRANAGAVETTILPKGAEWKFLDNGTEPGASWTSRTFDDSTWRSGFAEIGYGDGDETTVANFVDTDPAASGVQKNITTYFRKAFDIPNLGAIQSLVLRLVRDDGAVVYLNGTEIARSNMNEGPINSRTLAVAGVGGADESAEIEFLVQRAELPLQPAGNVLAVEVHQQVASSSDISFNLELVAYGTGTSSPAVINSPTVVKARVLSGGDWSALAEAYLTPDNVAPASSTNIVVSEIHYHPLEEGDNEFLEFLNTSGVPVDLSEATISRAVSFQFAPATVLAPGERIVVAKNLTLFRQLYGTSDSPYYRDVRVVGPWDGSLSNAGEKIELAGANGETLFECEYGTSGAWPGRADGKGSSLELINPEHVPLTSEEKSAWLTEPSHWRPSAEFHGSPGASGSGPDNRVVINEFLAAPIPPLTESIELKNRTTSDVDLSGWFLSDASGNYRKYRFPEGSKIAAGAYLVLREEDFNNPGNPACLIPFGLEDTGDDIYLISAQTNGALIAFIDRIEYPAAPIGSILGRWPDGTGPLRFLSTATLTTTNANPVPGYAAWAPLAFDAETPDAFREPSSDPDGDGLSNLGEYAFALNPLRKERFPLDVAGGNGPAGFTFTFRKRTSAPDLKYGYASSTDLQSWIEIDVEVLAEAPGPDGSSIVVARFSPNEDAFYTRRFLRIVVSVEPSAQSAIRK